MTFWQGLAISIIFHASEGNSNNESGDDDSASDSNSNGYSANSIQHILICMEMLFFSAAHWCVFPAEEWEDGYKMKFYDGPGFAFKDFASDVNLIIDSGKRSMQARREKQSESLRDASGTETSNNGGLSFGSTNEVDGKGVVNEPLV